MIFVLVMVYMSFVQRVYALPATPDVREYEFPNLLINEVSFKNTEHDFIEIIVSEYISNASKSLKGLQIIDDNMFFEIEDDLLVKSGDEIIISFKEDFESIEEVNEVLQIKLTKSGLTGTTEQVILKNHNNIIVDGICWTSDSPTQDEISDFEELYENEQWIESNISSCVNSGNIDTGISIGRKNKIDTNSANDWEIVLEEVVDENFENNNVENEEDDEISDETNLDEILEKTTNSSSEKITSPQIEDICEDGILINEIMPNPSGKDTGKEWIELVNINDKNCNLYGWQIDDQDGGSKPYLIYDLNIKGGGGFLLLPSWETKLNLNNSEDEVRLFDSEGKVVSKITYESAADGQSFAMTNEDEYKWSIMPTPLLPNEFPEEETLTQKKETEKSSKDNDEESNKNNIENGTLSDAIYITEIFPNPQGGDSGNEWIEIHNESNEKTNLGNWEIDTGEDSKKTFTFENISIDPGKYITLSDKDLGFALKNSKNELRLLDFENSEIDKVVYEKVIENASFMKIIIENEENEKDKEITWKWNKNISPGKENQNLYKYVGKIENFDEINSVLNLQVENGNTNTLVFHIIQSGDNVLSHIFKEDVPIQIIASKENDKLIMETYEISEQTQNLQNEEDKKSGEENSLYTALSFLPPLGFMGYFGIKKWGLIKII
jgi:Lamin Tail Domain